MSTTKTTTQRIESLQEKIQQLENEKKRLLNVQKAADRKVRTKRLIERGAILESLIDHADTLTNEQIKSFLIKTVQNDFAKRILDGVTKQGGETAAAKAPMTVKNNTASASDKPTDTAQGGGGALFPCVSKGALIDNLRSSFIRTPPVTQIKDLLRVPGTLLPTAISALLRRAFAPDGANRGLTPPPAEQWRNG